MMRVHFVCAEHRDHAGMVLGCTAETVLRTDLPPVRSLRKKCCFCPKLAICRLRTDVPSSCPPGHVPPGTLEAIGNRALEASLTEAEKLLAESPVLGLGR